jgi:hypothetical protein
VSQRRQYLLFFGLVSTVVVTALALGRPPARAGLLDTVPQDAWLVVTLDVAALRASPFAKPILGGGGGGETLVAGEGTEGAANSASVPASRDAERPHALSYALLGSLTARCGFDPIARVRQVVVTSPEGGERGDFGVAFTGDFTKDELARCADRVIRARGGSPSPSTRGGFTQVEDSTDPMRARLAYREGGPFLVGRGAWLDAMIDATERKTAGLRSEHTELRAALAAKDGDAEALIVTALLPASVRDKLKAELGPELSSEGDQAYAGVLAVSAAGLALGLGDAAGPSTTRLRAQMRCDSASACDEVKRLIERKRAAFSRDLALRLAGLGPLLDSLTVDARGTELTATARGPGDELAHALERILAFTGRGGGDVRRERERSPAAPSTPPPP